MSQKRAAIFTSEVAETKKLKPTKAQKAPAKAAVRTAWRHEESAWIVLYHALIITYALKHKEAVSMLSRTNICLQFNAYFQALNNVDLGEGFRVDPKYVKRTYKEWIEHCRDTIPNTLHRLEKYVTEDGDTEWAPIITYDTLNSYVAMDIIGEQDTPENDKELHDLLLRNLHPRLHNSSELDRTNMKRGVTAMGVVVERGTGTSRLEPTQKWYSDMDSIKNTAIMPPVGYGGDPKELLNDKHRTKVMGGLPNLTEPQSTAIEENIEFAKEAHKRWQYEVNTIAKRRAFCNAGNGETFESFMAPWEKEELIAKSGDNSGAGRPEARKGKRYCRNAYGEVVELSDSEQSDLFRDYGSGAV